MMIDLWKLVQSWERKDKWYVVPDGCPFAKKGRLLSVREGVLLGEDVSIGNKVKLGRHVRIKTRAILGYDVHIGDYTYIGGFSTILSRTRIREQCRIGESVHIEAGTVLGKNVFIEDHVDISRNVRIGNDAVIGKSSIIYDNACIDSYVSIGAHARIGEGATDVIDLGVTDEFRKCLYYKNGQPWIGAGCRQMFLADAVRHWSAKHPLDRRASAAQMAYAVSLHKLRMQDRTEANDEGHEN